MEDCLPLDYHVSRMMKINENLKLSLQNFKSNWWVPHNIPMPMVSLSFILHKIVNEKLLNHLKEFFFV